MEGAISMSNPFKKHIPEDQLQTMRDALEAGFAAGGPVDPTRSQSFQAGQEAAEGFHQAAGWKQEDTYYCGLCGYVPIARPCVHMPGGKHGK